MTYASNRNNTSQARSAIRNTKQFEHYYNRLLELSISMFEWKNVPDEIDITYLELVLFSKGQALFFKEEELDEYVAMKFNRGAGYDIYQIPQLRHAYANNGYYRELNPQNSVIVYNNMIRTPAQIDIELFAERLASLDRVVDVNTNAQKTPVLIEARDEGQKLSLLNLYKQYEGNEPVVFGYKGIGESLKSINTQAPFVSDKIYELKTQIWNEALTYLGISNVNFMKRERMITDEVTRNQGGTIASRYSRLESRRRACKLINKMFGLDIWVDYREDYQEIEGADDTVDGHPNSDGHGGELEVENGTNNSR